MHNPNLQQQTTTYKDLLLRKLSYAVTCSLFSQLFILQFYVFLSKTDIVHPLEWFRATVNVMTAFPTWLLMIPFMSIIFLQSVICAKDYVIKSSYCSTRFQKFANAFSLHNFVLLILHVLLGGVLIWLFLTISGGQNLIERCKMNYCLNGDTLFLISSGPWTGFYFFVKVYVAEKNLAFPLIQQRKFLQFKSQLGPLIREAVLLSFWPSFAFSAIYYFFYGNFLENCFKELFGLIDDEAPISTNSMVYMHLWFFGALYYFNMNLMRFYFNLFLTEPVQFPLGNSQLTLQESILNQDWPIVQNLACLDLHLLAQWAPARRQVIFSLSNPGGHPHNWNSLADSVLKLISEYTRLLNNTVDVPSEKVLSSPIRIQSPNKYRSLRNMSLNEEVEDFNYVTVSTMDFSFLQNFLNIISAKFISLWNFIKMVTGINFLFGELPQANIRKCLANGNLIIWSAQGISNIVAASLVEDRYGVVQKDIPAIVTSLVDLKRALDKLGKVPALTRRTIGQDDFNYRMKGAVASAVKRSIFNIGWTFRDNLKDIPLSEDVCEYLRAHVLCKS